jgi:hypothetical protein
MLILVIHFATSCYMTGLCWLVQLVVYPQFARVGAERFAAYHRAHMAWTSAAVVPVMVTEAVLASLIFYWHPRDPLAIAGIALLAVVWINTFAQEVPTHEKLKAGHDLRVIRRLVVWNWPRTLAWTGRAVVGGWMILRNLPG